MSAELNAQMRQLCEDFIVMMRRVIDQPIDVGKLSPEAVERDSLLVSQLLEAMQDYRSTTDEFLADPSEDFADAMEDRRDAITKLHTELIEHRIAIGVLVTSEKARDIAEGSTLHLLAMLQKHLKPEHLQEFAGEMLAETELQPEGEHPVLQDMHAIIRKLFEAAAKPKPDCAPRTLGPTDVAANEEMPECLRLVCAHLVGLTWYQGEANEDGEYNGQPEWRCASAFIVDVAGIAWLVTAGHVFTEIDKLKKNPRFKIKAARLCDIWSPLSTTTVTVPFDFFDQEVKRYSIDRADQGIDLAFIPLNRYLTQFLAQTIVPFRRDDWIESDSHDYDTYYVIGTPSCLAEDEVTKTETGGTITVTHEPFILGVNRIDDDGSEVDTTGNPQFVARIHEAFPIPNVFGMSGGPILGFRRDDKGEFRYWPVAVQSRWLPKKRIVIGTLLAPCLREFEKVVLQRLADAIGGANGEVKT